MLLLLLGDVDAEGLVVFTKHAFLLGLVFCVLLLCVVPQNVHYRVKFGTGMTQLMTHLDERTKRENHFISLQALATHDFPLALTMLPVPVRCSINDN